MEKYSFRCYFIYFHFVLLICKCFCFFFLTHVLQRFCIKHTDKVLKILLKRKCSWMIFTFCFIYYRCKTPLRVLWWIYSLNINIQKVRIKWLLCTNLKFVFEKKIETFNIKRNICEVKLRNSSYIIPLSSIMKKNNKYWLWKMVLITNMR